MTTVAMSDFSAASVITLSVQVSDNWKSGAFVPNGSILEGVTAMIASFIMNTASCFVAQIRYPYRPFIASRQCSQAAVYLVREIGYEPFSNAQTHSGAQRDRLVGFFITCFGFRFPVVGAGCSQHR